jgi:hypothetical protein
MNKPAGKIEAAKPAKAKPEPANDAPEPSIYERLAAEFPRDAIHWRSQKLTQSGNKALALAYLDARDVQDRLDQVCTPAGWRNTVYETPKGRVLSTIEILIDGQWVGKCDGAGDTAVEGEKGGISDAFKRSAVLWGIGRYLYRLPAVWAPCESREHPQGSGKRYFQKWIGSPWDQVPKSWNASTYTDASEGDEAKVEGISRIKEAMRQLQLEGNKATTLDEFNALVRANADDLTALKEDNHDWWAGDGMDNEGLKAWIVRRRAELTPKDATLAFQMLSSCLAACATRNDLNSLLDQHGSVAEQLDGEEAREWERLYNEREAAIMAISNVGAG